jgi:hypothetical protein
MSGVPSPIANAFPAGQAVPTVATLEPHSLIAKVRQVLAAAEHLGSPLGIEDRRALEATFTRAGAGEAALAIEAIQRVLDRWCLVDVHINSEMRVKVARGPARPALIARGWRPFLVKVRNEAGTTAPLRANSSAHGWLDLLMFDDPPLSRTLCGLELEYRIVQLYSRDEGQREASLSFDVGQGSQDLGFRNEVPILFGCSPAEPSREPT